MNCHKCKNPIEDNATECEWCGAILIKNKPTFTVILRSVGINKSAIVNTVREFTGLSFKDAKDKVDSAPTVIKEGCTQEEAEIIKVQLEKDGADAECFLSNEVTENKEINNSVAKKPSDWKETCLGCLFVLFAIFVVTKVVMWIVF
jgi:ribosomal protein L7/L12